MSQSNTDTRNKAEDIFQRYIEGLTADLNEEDVQRRRAALMGELRSIGLSTDKLEDAYEKYTRKAQSYVEAGSEQRTVETKRTLGELGRAHSQAAQTVPVH